MCEGAGFARREGEREELHTLSSPQLKICAARRKMCRHFNLILYCIRTYQDMQQDTHQVTHPSQHFIKSGGSAHMLQAFASLQFHANLMEGVAL